MSLPKPWAVLQPMLTMARMAVANSRTMMRLDNVVIYLCFGCNFRWCSRCDFVAHPLARLVETVLGRFIALREAGFDAVPGGLGGVLGLVKLLVQLGRLVAQRLKLGLGLGLDAAKEYYVYDFWNDRFIASQSKELARRLERQESDVARQVESACLLALGRPPRDDERAALGAYAKKYGLAQACRVLLNTNEFVFVD